MFKIKITVFADSHKDFHKLKNIVDDNLDSDLFVHLGDGQLELLDISQMYPDKEFVLVKGNSDFGTAKEERVITIGGYKAFCAHGHTLNVHSSLESLLDKAQFNNCKIALYGHTHIFKTEFVDGIYVMNPGSVSSPRGKNPPSYGIIEITEDDTIKMNIIEIK